MYEGKKILGLIPARGGSKGLPKKNILPLAGKPLIAWTIEQIKRSKYTDSFIVSTDDEEIASVSRKYGCEVPFIRPHEIATDSAKGIEVVFHALNWFESREQKFDILILLQPTSPLRKIEDIDNSIEMLFEKNAKAIVSVCKTEHHPLWSSILPPDGSMKDFLNQNIKNKNRQELPKYYRLNGAIYLSYCDYLKKSKSFLGEQTFAYIMPQERSIDIDSSLDFKFAEFLLQQ